MKRLLLSLFLILGTVGSLDAATYYVQPNGTGTTCTQAKSTATPFNEIADILSTSNPCSLTGGDIVEIRANTVGGSATFNERFDCNANPGSQCIPGGTSWALPLTIRARSGDTITIQPTGNGSVLYLKLSGQHHIIFDHLVIDAVNDAAANNAVHIQDQAHHIRFQNVEAKNSNGAAGIGCGRNDVSEGIEILDSHVHHNGVDHQLDHNIYVSCPNSIISGNNVHNAASIGIAIYSGLGIPASVANVSILNNRIYDNGGRGILAGGDSNSIIANNLVYGNGVFVAETISSGIHLEYTGGFDGGLVANNTIYDNAAECIQVGAESNAAIIRNNICYLNDTIGTTSEIRDDGVGTLFATNLCGETDTGCTSLGNPLFTSTAFNDFRLQVGSPAIGTGTVLADVDYDYGNLPRSSATFDIGAYRYPQLDALRNLAASLGAGEIGVLNERGDASGWGPGTDNPGESIRVSLSQAAKCAWDPTPYRGHHTYYTNGSYSVGDTVISIDVGSEPVVAGMVINFRAVPGEYTVTHGLPSGGAGTITISPGLEEAVADNTQIAMMKRGERVMYLGHSHNASTHSWPGWVLYESHDNQWKSPSLYRYIEELGDAHLPDPYEEALVGDWFHQNSGLAFNAAKQFLYRYHPSGNPTIMNRVNTGEYDPMDIGRITPFSISGTITFTTDSRTVTCSGTCAFMSELQPGYQIWRDGDELHNGISKWISTVESIQSNSSLTLVNDYDGSATPGTASASDPTTMLTHWRFEAGGAIASQGNYGSIEYFPEVDKLFMLDSRSGGSGGLYAKRTLRGDSAAWETIFTTTTTPSLVPILNTGFVNILHYNTKRHRLLIGIGIGYDEPPEGGFVANGESGMQFWEVALATPNDPLNSALTLTALDSYTAHSVQIGSVSGDLLFHDPITGKYLILLTDRTTGFPNNDYIFLQLDPDAASGSQITVLDDSAFSALELAGDGLGKQLAYNVSCVADTLGGVVILGGDKTFFYKHTANDRATDGLTTAEKRVGSGVLGYVPFGEEGFELKYVWNTTLESVYTPLATAMAGEMLYSLTEPHEASEGNYVVTTWPAFASAPRSDGGDGVGKGVIDPDVTYKGEPGSLKMPTKNQTGQSTGKFVTNIDGTYGGVSNEKQISPTLNALASTLSYQYAVRGDSNLLQTYPGHYPLSTFQHNSVSTTGINSAVVNLSNNVATMAWVGKKVYVDLPNPGIDPWVPGIYTINSVPATNQIELNESPTVLGTQGTNGIIWIEEDTADAMPANKMAILSGKVPSTDSSQAVEMALTWYNRGECPRYLGPYQQNAPGLTEETCFGGPLLANTWHLITWDFDFRPISQGKFNSVAVDSVNVTSSTITFSSQWAAFQGSYLWFSGFGPNSFDVDSSDCVPGIYQILSYNSGNNSIELDRSPSRMGTAATECEAYLATGNAGLDEYSRHNVRVWKDHTLVVEMNFRAGFAVNSSFYAAPGEELGLGNVSFNFNGNGRDTTFIHTDAYGWYSQPIFSTQPLAFDTATMADEPPGPPITSGPVRKARLRR